MKASDHLGQIWIIGILCAVPAAGQDYTISTIAGGAPPPLPAVATTASIGKPSGMAADAAGNVYFSTEIHCVFKLDTAGTLRLVAGNARPGYSGDGGPATSAQLNIGIHSGVAVDSAGNIYIADSSNNRVRRVAPSGIITTFAGQGSGLSGDDGLSDPRGVAVDSAGNLYIADTGNHRVRRVSGSGIISTVAGTGEYGFSGDGGPATSAQLRSPHGLAVDAAGNVYIVDTGNSRLRRISTGGVISTVGDGLAYPIGVAISVTGSVYVAEYNTNRVLRMIGPNMFTPAAGIGTPGYSGDGGPSTSARMNEPVGIAVDPAGNLYIADSYNNRVRRVAFSGSGMIYSGTISTVAGDGTFQYSGDGGPASSAQLAEPKGVAVDGAGNLYIADYLNHRIRRVSPTGIITTVAGSGVAGCSGDGGPAASAQLYWPAGVAVDTGGNIYFTDEMCSRVRRFSPGGSITTVAGNGSMGFSGDGGPPTAAQLHFPLGLALDPSGNPYIADTLNDRIRRVSPPSPFSPSTITTVAGNGARGYSGDGGPATSAKLYLPHGVAVDAERNLYIADSANNRIRRVSADGIITTVAGNGAYSGGDGGPAISAGVSPYSVALDGTGNLYIADPNNRRIRRVSASGIINSIAGTGATAYSGDGGPATSAELWLPMYIAVDHAGRVYFTQDNAVRVLTPGSCTTSATPAAFTAPPSGGALALTIQAGVGCAWSITGLPTWIAASATSGSGPVTVMLTAAANWLAPRSATIIAAGTQVTITQDKSSGVCTSSISSTDLGVAASGGTLVLSIHTDPGCAWSISGLPTWLTVSGASQGSGPAEVRLVAAGNANGARSASIPIGGVSVPIRQFDASVCGGSASCVTRALPHVAAGGEWTTSLFAVNSGAATGNFSVTFYDNEGLSMALPFTSGGNLSTLSDSVPPQGRKDYEAGGMGLPLQAGWGLLIAERSIAVQGAFRRATPGGAYYEAAVPASEGYSSFIIPFDASTFPPTGGPLYTGFAIANLNPHAAAHVTCTARDQWGGVIPNAVTIPALNPSGHYSEYLFPALIDKRGALECTADTLVSAIALRFIGDEAFSTLPVIVK